MWMENAMAYFSHMADSIFHGVPSVLVKILGVFKVRMKRKSTFDLSRSRWVIVLPNLFYNGRFSQVFDLKGSVRNRYAKAGADGNRAEVQLDQNFMEFTRQSTVGLPHNYKMGLPIPLFSSAKELLALSVSKDSSFLANADVVDYSMLVGFDMVRMELRVGIIDYIGKYTWDKKIEMGVKSVGMIMHKQAPTVIAPRHYKNRFRAALNRYFMIAPSPASHSSLLGLPSTPLREGYRAVIVAGGGDSAWPDAAFKLGHVKHTHREDDT